MRRGGGGEVGGRAGEGKRGGGGLNKECKYFRVEVTFPHVFRTFT